MKPIGYEFHADYFCGLPPSAFGKALETAGMVEEYAEGGPFLPLQFWSFRSTDKEAFNRVLAQGKEALKAFLGLSWYSEAEVVVSDVTITQERAQFNPVVLPPMKVRVTPQLASSNRCASEFHLTFREEDVDPALVGRIVMSLDAYPARFIKSDHTNLVFTVQGEIAQIAQIVPRLETYLRQCGGFTRADLKLENLTWFAKGQPEVQLPPRIKTLELL